MVGMLECLSEYIPTRVLPRKSQLASAIRSMELLVYLLCHVQQRCRDFNRLSCVLVARVTLQVAYRCSDDNAASTYSLRGRAP